MSFEDEHSTFFAGGGGKCDNFLSRLSFSLCVCAGTRGKAIEMLVIDEDALCLMLGHQKPEKRSVCVSHSMNHIFHVP